MKYDFDTVINRKGTDSAKWDVKENELPMWVADMDFKAAPEIIDAVRQRLDEGVLGYPVISDEWYRSYINWWSTRHDFTMEKDALIFCAGVIPGISSMIRAFSKAGENVLIQPPVYNAFFGIIRDNGRNILESPLIYKNGEYMMDLEDLDRKMADPKTDLMILCNPHNPIGKIWSKEDLAKVGELAKKHGVTVISDEIHCDLTEPQEGYIPFASVSDTCADVGISCMAPTKAFNLAGLKTSAVYAKNPDLRKRVTKTFYADELSEPNSFANTGAIAAFEKGGEWLDELRQYLSENRKTVREYLLSHIPEIKAVDGHATYLVWLDISGLNGNVEEFSKYLREKTGLFVSPGVIFGSQGKNFLRMNIACPRSVVKEGLSRLADGVRKWNDEHK